MRSFLLISVCFLMAACSDNADTYTQENDTVSVEIEDLPPTLLDQSFTQLFWYFKEQDSSFDASLFDEGTAAVLREAYQADLDTAMLRQYKPYLLFNADSSYALDLVSYNFLPEKKKGKTVMEEQGPDFEAAIIDLKQNLRTRLLFFGSSGGAVLDAKWENNHSVMIAGAIDWQNADSLRPVAWRYNVLDKSLQQFHYPKMINADWSKYPRQLFELNR
ncbi:MAG: hypothetical protein EOP49_31550 [Sphingobacteriales bacterium]|nr:MAG: hypothetical protein EOP49_31550 [Sphingobacteriales bacterium]